MLGALALAMCQLADGRVDGVATLKPSRSVDLAAAWLIVREAGADGSWPALVLWIVLCASDGIDGPAPIRCTLIEAATLANA